jgi:hypothetical protein
VNRKTIKQDYTIHNHILEVVEESKYLGVTISKDLTWKAHINNITNKVNKTLGFIKRNIHICLPTFVTCQDIPGVYWYLMLYLPPYTINNRLQRAWLKSVSFQVGRLCDP